MVVNYLICSIDIIVSCVGQRDVKRSHDTYNAKKTSVSQYETLTPSSSWTYDKVK